MNIIRSEVYKILKSKVFYGVSIVLLFMNAVSLIFGIREKIKGVVITETGISAYISSYADEGFIYIILVFVAFLVTSEYANGTIRQMACRGIERWKLIFGQYIAISLVSTILIIGFGLINLIFFTLLNKLGTIEISKLITINLGLICLIWAMSAIGTLISYLVKNVGVSIITSLVLVKGSDFGLNLIDYLIKKDIFAKYSLTNIRRIVLQFHSQFGEILKYCGLLVLISIFAIMITNLLFSKWDIN